MTLQTKDRATIADLQVYGLSIRLINDLEKSHGCVYVDDLRTVTANQLSRANGRGGPFGAGGIAELRTALVAFLEGRSVKTPEACVAFTGAKRRSRKG